MDKWQDTIKELGLEKYAKAVEPEGWVFLILRERELGHHKDREGKIAVFHAAIETQDLNKVKFVHALLNEDIRKVDNEGGRSFLQKASFIKDMKIFNYLQDVGIDKNLKNADGQTLVEEAAKAGRTDIAERIMENRMTDKERSMSPLVRAIYADSPTMLQEAIAKGGDVNQPDVNGMTPLMHAASLQKNGIIKTLLSAKANPHATNPKNGNKSALDYIPHTSELDAAAAYYIRNAQKQTANMGRFSNLAVKVQDGPLKRAAKEAINIIGDIASAVKRLKAR